jgi:hypothetical protein
VASRKGSAAQDHNAENVLVVRDDPALAQAYRKNWLSRAGVARPLRDFHAGALIEQLRRLLEERNKQRSRSELIERSRAASNQSASISIVRAVKRESRRSRRI